MWCHVVVEGFCFGDRPCARERVSTFCMGHDGKHCPHFMFSDSNEREAAYWAPLHLIIWDKIREHHVWGNLAWHLWRRWFYKRPEWMKDIKVVENPEIDQQEEECRNAFPAWMADQVANREPDAL